MPKFVSVLFVCIGNICRSPTAEGIFKSLVSNAGLTTQIQVDSAGSMNYHVGESPHPTTIQAATQRGYKLEGHARQYSKNDLEEFDYIVGMDMSNKLHLQSLSSENSKAQIISFIDLCPTYKDKFSDVPDPYYGGVNGFDLVIDVVEEGCQHLLEKIKKDHNL